MTITTRNRISHIIMYIILLAVAVITIIPILSTILGAFKTNMEIMTEPGRLFPKTFTFDNFIEAWNSKSFNVPRLFLNSLMYTLFNVFVAVMVSSMGGYVFSRGDFPCKKIIFGCFISLMFIKLGGINVYPMFDILNLLHLKTSLWTLMLIQLFGVPIVNVYLVKGYVDSLPKELDEAAKMDGCSFAGTFFKIIMPLLKPILATVAILSYQNSWNDYIMPTVFTLTKSGQRTLIVGLMALKNSDGAATSWNLMLAGSTISILPVLIAYAIGNKYFVAGLSAGAVKG